MSDIVPIVRSGRHLQRIYVDHLPARCATILDLPDMTRRKPRRKDGHDEPLFARQKRIFRPD